MGEVTLEEFQEVFYSELIALPFHQRVGLVVDRDAPPGEPRVTLPARSGIVSESGEHSPAAVHTLADAAAAIEVCEEAAPRALELGMGAIFFTTAGRIRLQGPARGTVGATAEMVKGLDPATGGPGESRKEPVEVVAKLTGEGGEQIGHHRSTFYVRFIELSRMRGMFPPTSAVARIFEA